MGAVPSFPPVSPEDNDKSEVEKNDIDKVELEQKIEELKERMQNYNKFLEELTESKESQISITDPDSRLMVSNQKADVCYNIQTTVDAKHKLIIDYEVTNEATDYNQLSKMGKRAKEILEVEEVDVLADKGYYKSTEIKECVDNGITPYIPKPKESKKSDIPEEDYLADKFIYEEEKDVYKCPEGKELSYTTTIKCSDRMMRQYKSNECALCSCKGKCTRNENGRIILRWEHEKILEAMEQRVAANKEKMKARQCLSEHPFGTIKRGFDQGYMLLKGMEKVTAEIGLSVLVYNIKRVINIIGIKKLIAAI